MDFAAAIIDERPSCDADAIPFIGAKTVPASRRSRRSARWSAVGPRRSPSAPSS